MTSPEHGDPETRRIVAEVRNDILEHWLNFPKTTEVVEVVPIQAKLGDTNE